MDSSTLAILEALVIALLLVLALVTSGRTAALRRKNEDHERYVQYQREKINDLHSEIEKRITQYEIQAKELGEWYRGALVYATLLRGQPVIPITDPVRLFHPLSLGDSTLELRANGVIHARPYPEQRAVTLKERP